MGIIGTIAARRARRWAAPALLAACVLAVPLRAAAAELLVFESPHCGPCLRFDREVAALYPKTDEARRLPLRRLAWGEPLPSRYAFVAAARVAPTFVLVDDGRELSRFEGYGGDELFWMRLAVEMRKLPAG